MGHGLHQHTHAVCKLYGRVMIKSVRDRTECAIAEEQCSVRKVERKLTKCFI